MMTKMARMIILKREVNIDYHVLYTLMYFRGTFLFTKSIFHFCVQSSVMQKGVKFF